MKRIFYLFGLILFVLNFAQGQDLTTITQEGRQWSTEIWNPVSPPELYTEIYRIEGDTALDGKTYKKIYCYHTQDLSNRTLYSYACRQDGKKVYVRFYGDQSEKLFFDFSLKVGDTLSVAKYDRHMKVIAVGDTVINGRASRYVRLMCRNRENYHKEDVWVEGLGSLDYGISWAGMSMYVGAKKYTLLCCYQGNDLLWKKSEDGECFVGGSVSTESLEVLNPTQWKLLPQPAGEAVQAICMSSESAWQRGQWYLHDLSGKRLQSGKFTDGRFEISLRHIPQGLYMIEIKAARGGDICRLKCVKGR